MILTTDQEEARRLDANAMGMRRGVAIAALFDEQAPFD
jgi:hypothetical protein